MSKTYFSIPKALLMILSSIVVISGSAILGYLYHQYQKEIKKHDPKYHITSIVSKPNHLSTDFLAEMLDLSIDNPTNLFSLNVNYAQKKMESFPMIRAARISKVPPNGISIEYSMREPIGLISDYKNTAIDAEGYTFPYYPYYPEKILPLISLGNDSDIQQVEELLSLIDGIQRIDVSQANASSYGQRQIVLTLNNGHILRLSHDKYRKELENYLDLREYLTEKKWVVDLRIPQLAFIKEE